MIAKYIQMDFIDPRIHASNMILDLQKAVDHAATSLENNSGIVLSTPEIYNSNDVIFEMDIPDKFDNAPIYSVNSKLRGIGRYLLNTWPETYEPYMKGNGSNSTWLLTYRTVKKPCTDANPTVDDRIKAISDFSTMMRRTDPISLSYVNQILDIMNKYNAYGGGYADNG